MLLILVCREECIDFFLMFSVREVGGCVLIMPLFLLFISSSTTFKVTFVTL